jgi:hypothetical protein
MDLEGTETRKSSSNLTHRPKNCLWSVIVSCCYLQKLIAEAGDSSVTQRKWNVAVGSRYQATAVKM